MSVKYSRVRSWAWPGARYSRIGAWTHKRGGGRGFTLRYKDHLLIVRAVR